MDEPVVNTEPVDRLTRICDAMTVAFDEHPEHRDGDKAIVFLDDDERAGIVLHGYEDQTMALVDLLMHLKVIFASQGKHLDLMFMDEEGTSRI